MMFFDERIFAESGTIYRRGILAATLITLVYGMIRALYLASLGELMFRYFIMEGSIVLCGGLLLLIGSIHYTAGADERILAERNEYDVRSGTIFLFAGLFGYGLSLPFALEKSFEDFPPNHLILMLEVLGCLYFCYTFKCRNINFNYSFIAEERYGYYGHVFLNIGKLAGILAPVFAVAMMISLRRNTLSTAWISIINGYLFSVLGLGAEYLFLSWAEKASYDDEESMRLKKGTVIVGVVALMVLILTAVTDLARVFMTTGNLSTWNDVYGTMTSKLKVLNNLLQSFGNITIVLVGMWYCHFLTQARGAVWVKRSVFGLLLVLAAEVLRNFVSMMVTVCVYSRMTEVSADVGRMNRMLSFLSLGSELTVVAMLILQVILVAALIKEMGVSRKLWIAPILRLVVIPFQIFFYMQSMLVAYTALASIAEILSAVIGLMILCRHCYDPAVGRITIR